MRPVAYGQFEIAPGNEAARAARMSSADAAELSCVIEADCMRAPMMKGGPAVEASRAGLMCAALCGGRASEPRPRLHARC